MTNGVGVIRTNITIPAPVFTEVKKMVKKPLTFSGLVTNLVAEWVTKKKSDRAFEALRGSWVRGGGPDFKNLTEYNRWKAKLWGPATRRMLREARELSD